MNYICLILALGAGIGSPTPLGNPYTRWSNVGKRNGLVVDLGYEVYSGEISDGVLSWRGIRYGASPAGKNRWQAPRVPELNRTATILADDWPPMCAQNSGSLTEGSEDCLYLNVHSPEDASNLPVYVFIHGGGYHSGSGAIDPTDFILNNEDPFITVFIQYRLGVFGFLSSEEIHQKGKLNAGILDMELALQWVQNYIHLFGGNARKVTISGESAGAGAVMLLAILRGGQLGESLFSSIIAASTFLPKQFKYNDDVPTENYRSVANYTGCGNKDTGVFDCLVKSNVTTISNAGEQILEKENLYNWGLMPVTDGVYIQDIPSRQLREKRVNGRSILIGNNANEGPEFTPQNIVTETDFKSYLKKYFPAFSDRELEKVMEVYPSSGDTNPTFTNYSTLGYKGPTALQLSDFANGEQQRANNLQAEITFVCPAYWLAEAMPEAWKYEFSVPPAPHGFDVGAYFFTNQSHPDFSTDFVMAFQNIWGNFITKGDPRISWALECGSTCSQLPTPRTDIHRWHPYSRRSPIHLSANVTRGTPASYNFSGRPIPYNIDPRLANSFTLADAYTWEGGRGRRCDFWQEMAWQVPE